MKTVIINKVRASECGSLSNFVQSSKERLLVACEVQLSHEEHVAYIESFSSGGFSIEGTSVRWTDEHAYSAAGE